MNFTLNNKYFKGSSPLFWIAGLAVIAVGIILMFMQDMLPFGIIIAVAALLYLGIYFGSRAKDSDITDGLNIRLDQLRGEARADYEEQFANTKKIGNPKIYEFTRFLYEPKEPGGLFKTRRSSFGEVFTSRYSMTLLYMDDTNRRVNVYRFTLSLIEDDDEMDITVMPYGGFTKAWLDDRDAAVKVGKETLARTCTEFHIETNDGTDVCFPCVRDATTESLVMDMNFRYNKKKEES